MRWLKLLFLVSLFSLNVKQKKHLVFTKNLIPKENSWLLMTSKNQVFYSNHVFPDNHLKGRRGETHPQGIVQQFIKTIFQQHK